MSATDPLTDAVKAGRRMAAELAAAITAQRELDAAMKRVTELMATESDNIAKLSKAADALGDPDA